MEAKYIAISFLLSGRQVRNSDTDFKGILSNSEQLIIYREDRRSPEVSLSLYLLASSFFIEDLKIKILV